MGEAFYTIEATFPTVAKARAACTRLEGLIKERAEDWWQDHRHLGPEEFWPQFRRLHPLAVEVLALSVRHDWSGGTEKILPALDGDCNNGLASVLDFADNVWQDEDRKPNVPVISGARLRYTARVWHFVQWAGLAKWLRNLGATSVRWQTESSRYRLDAEGEMHRVGDVAPGKEDK